jgi:hypothetical protein
MDFENATETARQKLEDVKSAASEKLDGVKSAAADKVNGALDAANSTINAAGEKISETGARLWERAPEGPIGEAIGNAAAEIEQAGEYLAEASVQDLSADLAGFVRKHPLQSLAAGLIVGGLAGLAFSRLRSALKA